MLGLLLGALIETVLMAACVAVGLALACRQPASARRGRAASWLARRRWLAVGCVGVAAGVLGAVISWTRPPLPAVHDEFSHLLAADTLARGRLANPTHPMWQHFESFHVLQQPRYVSKFPPGQGAVLAVGRLIGGHPLVGVWLSTALAAAAVCWMLQGWVPPRWALLGGVLVVFHVGIQRFWGQSFWGGNVALAGGALVYGALPRIVRGPRASAAVLMAAGLLLLANTRPYEGLVVSLPALAFLAAWMFGRSRPPVKALLVKVLLPGAVVLGLGGAFMAYYNVSTTGSPLRLPYQVYEATYDAAPKFLWQSPAPQPAYRHRQMRNFHAGWELRQFRSQQSLSGFARTKALNALNLWAVLLCPTLTVPLLAIPFVLRDRRMGFVVATLLLALCASMATTWFQPHYFAPAACLLLLVVVQGMRHLRCWNRRGRLSGRTVLAAIVAAYVLAFAAQVALYAAARPKGMAPDRAAVMAQLRRQPDAHLVVVRYGPRHNPFDEWVYNDADINDAKVVWARELGPDQDRELLDYFKDRRAWLLLADERPPRLVPYRTVPATPPASPPRPSSARTPPRPPSSAAACRPLASRSAAAPGSTGARPPE